MDSKQIPITPYSLVEPRKISLGWIPDKPDARDQKLYSGDKKLKAFQLPNLVDHRPFFGLPNSQGVIGSCTSQCSTDSLEYVDKKLGLPVTEYSRLFVYYNSRQDKVRDTGAFLRDVLKSIKQLGICSETHWPYVEKNFSQKPPSDCYTTYCISQSDLNYSRLVHGYQVKAALAEGFPICFGITVYDSFFEIGSDGKVPIPDLKNETPAGGHAMLLVGYNLSEKYYIVRNSWGVGWGDKGYCYIPFQLIDNPNFSDDFWVVRKNNGNNKPVSSFSPQKNSLLGHFCRLKTKLSAALNAFIVH